MSDIKIVVACHKESELPKSKLYYPVHVGAELAKSRLNMPGDNTGDNISTKNETYCELTAQYWAWKNLEADYYGLCHYRRFLSFANDKFKEDVRKQVKAQIIDDDSQKKYALSDEQAMRSIIEKYDVVVAQQQDVTKLPTPYGMQVSTYQHWAAHDGYMIMKKDLDKMLEIFCTKYPQMASTAHRYMNGKRFLGFNCFVMKKQFFDEMCSMEFDVLNELEKYVDRSNYSQQINRIYGFMGEILFSIYVEYLQEQHLAQIKEVQMVYFEQTDPVSKLDIQPMNDGQTVIPVFFNQANISDALYLVGIESFLKNISEENTYDVILLNNGLKPYFQAKVKKMASTYKNVVIRSINNDALRAIISEKYNMNCDPFLFLPWLMKHYPDGLVFNGSVLFSDDAAELYKNQIDSDKWILSGYDLDMLSELNNGNRECYNYVKNTLALKEPYLFYSINSVKMNFELIRENISVSKAAKMVRTLYKNNRLIPPSELFNVLYEGKVMLADQRWNTCIPSTDYLIEKMARLPYRVFKKNVEAQKNPAVINYREDYIWNTKGSVLADLFWEYAKSSEVYELCINQCRQYKPSLKTLRRMEKLLPSDSKRREFVNKILPYGSKKYLAAKKIISKIKK